MKRTGFLLLFFISVFLCYSKNNPQDAIRFFYDGTQKMLMYKTDEYICVKFKKEITQPARNISLSRFNSLNVSSADNAYGKYSIIKIENVSDKPAIVSSLIADNNIEYCGSCFRYNDKVLHFTTNEIIIKFNKNLSEFDIKNLNSVLNTSVVEKVSSITGALEQETGHENDIFENLYLIKINNKGEINADDVFDA